MDGTVPQFFVYTLEQLPFVFLTLIAAFSVHEFSHAQVAYWLGDDTAEKAGRRTLSPFDHFDIIGTLAILFWGFGWAKPVPVTVSSLKGKRWGNILVSIAGPLSNLLLAFLAILLWNIGVITDIFQMFPELFVASAANFMRIFVLINLTLAVFNMLPFPPLDGWRIVCEFLPIKAQMWFSKYEMYGILVFFLIVITPLGDWTIRPLMLKSIPMLNEWLVSLVTRILL
ncbi:MAG: site-2 protease family protein [Bacilli bacterium]